MGYPGESLRIPQPSPRKKLTRREMLVMAGNVGVAWCFLGLTAPTSSCGESKSGGSRSSPAASAPTPFAPVPDDQFLDNPPSSRAITKSSLNRFTRSNSDF
jgi:hypothetical protein